MNTLLQYTYRAEKAKQTSSYKGLLSNRSAITVNWITLQEEMIILKFNHKSGNNMLNATRGEFRHIVGDLL